MKILLAPHNDDETLFAAFTIMRHKPRVIVCTDSAIQFKRGDGVTADQRRQETSDAMGVLKAKFSFAGIPDDELTEENLEAYFVKQKLTNPDHVFAPAVYENGNPHHNIVGRVAEKLWPGRVTFYATYQKHDITLTGNVLVIPTQEEAALKNEALLKYPSQWKLNRAHFDAVIGKGEYYVA